MRAKDTPAGLTRGTRIRECLGMKTARVLVAVMVGGLGASFVPAAGAAGDNLMTAVYGKTVNGYQRTRLPNGSFKREYYALSNGGTLPGTTRDVGMDETLFPKIANALGQSLARQNYILAPDAKTADLLLIVHWGKTAPFNDLQYRDSLNAAGQASRALAAEGGVDVRDQSVEARLAAADFEHYLMEVGLHNDHRRRLLQSTAEVLGYVGELDADLAEGRFGIREDLYNQFVTELEDPRYYVVVIACDFKETLKQKKPVPLWVTRMSIRAHRTTFERGLSAMMASASRRLGQSTGRVLRGVEQGRVEIGEATVIGSMPGPEPANEKK